MAIKINVATNVHRIVFHRVSCRSAKTPNGVVAGLPNRSLSRQRPQKMADRSVQEQPGPDSCDCIKQTPRVVAASIRSAVCGMPHWEDTLARTDLGRLNTSWSDAFVTNRATWVNR
ncbi:hypothetical protein PBRA_004447 [Plasmodiophora brassicae]|uniref:Uncharacterized protein n=1 Tax=Plasmodiophora brassicae TaxID=37360 RepID=A0A0G4IKP6_PLABS|nr:hypothetical protein PBRA_004447 [Plasmodiophora brassicae]